MTGLHIAAATEDVLLLLDGTPRPVWCQDCRRNCTTEDPCGCCVAAAVPLADEPEEHQP